MAANQVAEKEQSNTSVKVYRRPRDDDSDDDSAQNGDASLSALQSAINDSPLVTSLQIMMDYICYCIAEYLMTAKLIDIDYKTMMFNINKTGYSEAEGSYGISKLFKAKGTYCSGGETGNTVDILVDLQHEYTLTKLRAQSPNNWFTCPLEQVYLWVFNARMTQQEVKQHAEQLFTTQKFEPLDTEITVIDPETKERRRDELVPVCYIAEKSQQGGWKESASIPDYIKGRYVLFKLIASGISNVDASFVGVEGFRM
mmetsp:Transcript_11743/g.18969  ORF Transcript_11743/g.18969 Transcript_11743/m.18969 type:complete len:256 (+) Transcript_11743:36-803(+)|eukprot:CAMPEP_0197057190 /NCGR_PEP_ID=MMETSP1384-20130603/94018_1 /TAXON_ID=29189 /ORGANISM="Ammonia sp." /LENGTH=255 /DNA_ID=CAMNT_0042491503 /DNA_START=35 /DNA_END=802 /DNA_ORIENTATION=-